MSAFADIKCFVCNEKQTKDEDRLIRVRGIGMVHQGCIKDLTKAIEAKQGGINV